VRRLTVLLALAVLPLVLAACNAADAQKAQDLLAQAKTAEQSVRSEGFNMNISIDAAGKSVQIGATGGAVLKGDGAGSFYAVMNTSIPGAAPSNIVMMKRGQSFTMTTNGVTQTVPMPATLNASAPTGFDPNSLTQYVKDVSVSTVNVNGETEDEVLGTIDGDALLSNFAGAYKGLLKGVGASLGDIKVTLLFSRDTHLMETALIDMTMHVEKQQMHMTLSYAVTSVNQPVTFPS
jgi:type II secretory pathway pseudopilin PulG